MVAAGRSPLVVACALSLGELMAPSDARAFCRTTTVPAPAGYNPAIDGCWHEGIPLAWRGEVTPPTRVPYAVAPGASKYVTWSDAVRVADLAFDAWNLANCAGAQPTVHAYDEGLLGHPLDGGTCTSNGSCDAVARDLIVFDDDSWPYNDKANTLALTTVTFGVDDGTILQATINVNTSMHPVALQVPTDLGSGAFDLQAILTHEAGHFLGLAHATETTSIMYAYYSPGAVNLTADDLSAICSVYSPLAPPANPGCSVTAGASPRGLESWAAIAAALCAMGTRLRRRSA
jgi:hypothetical protein